MTRLSLGRSVAQFLSAQSEADYTVLKWLSISKGGEEKAYSIYYSEVLSDEEESGLDLMALAPVDYDNDPVITEFNTIEEALVFAAETYGALAHKYVAESAINEEYISYLKANNGASDQGSVGVE